MNCKLNRIDRRQLLRGFGAVSLALPCLESMHCAAEEARAANADPLSPRRFVAISAGLGFHAPHLFPAKPGRLKPETPYLEQLKEHLANVTLFSGLSHPEQQGNNGHASALTFLTSAQRPGLAGFRNTISLDQRIALEIGPQTRYPYLALTTRGSSSLSWTASGVSIPGESSPAKLFQSLFVDGSPAEVAAEMAGVRRGKSILDTVGERARSLSERVSNRDRQKLDEYLSSVRELEGRLQQSEGWLQRPKPRVDVNLPQDIADQNEAIERQRLLYDIVVLALQTDSTRTVTLELGGLNSVPKIPGVSSDWHGLSHHGKDPDKIDELRRIEEAEFQVFGEFLGKLSLIQEMGSTLLDQTAILFGSNLGNASSHDWHNLPILVAGGGYRHGNYVAHDARNNTPLANLFVAMARRMGVEMDRFGSSTAETVDGLVMT